MKLIEALEINRKPVAPDAERVKIALVCGFNPLHLNTFLTAHLRLALPDRSVKIHSGLYGDFLGNLSRLKESECDAAFVVIEWSDLDARLGIRGLGSWAPAEFKDIAANIAARCSQIERLVQELAKSLPLVVSFPTLLLPPISYTASWQSSPFEAQIHSLIAALAAAVAQSPGVKVVNGQRLLQISPVAERMDAESELRSGFPYSLAHAVAMADSLVRLFHGAAPKKGIITDLDDTLWSGILGEVGAAGVSWDLDHHTHMHGAYQRLLHALAESGVLVGVASKNTASLVEEAFQREDIILPRNAVFPLEAHWSRKSESVERILKAWNIGADAVVFVDDSPMEIAEVQQKFPAMRGLHFPAGNNGAVLSLLYELRDLFGKSVILEEDKIRAGSLRQAQAFAEAGQASEGAGASGEFLAQAEAELALIWDKDPPDPRALELINKTNQFNLNGKRHTEASWRAYLKDPRAFLLLVSYKDKFGPLGKIAVLAGTRQGKTLMIDHWVMSCRAFSRRIEYRCLEELFARFEAEEAVFDYIATARNQPLQEFLGKLFAGEPAAGYHLSREDFVARTLPTFHQVRETANG